MALPQAGVELVAQGLSGFVSDMGKANNAVSNFGDAGSKAASVFKSGFGEIVKGALREVGALAIDALGKAAIATGKFLTDSISLAGDFQQGMLEFQAVAGKDVDTKGLDQFHDLFIQLGKDLPVSTSEVQKAAIEMVKGGIDPATVAAGGLRQNIQFAAAAMGGDLAAAAEVSAKILGGWSSATATAAEKSAFLTSATDLLTKAANASSVDVHELSLGIFNAQGIAKAAGVKFEDLTTVLAELAPRFASSSEAGTSLKNMIARLQPQTKKQTGAMQALGLYTEETGSAFYDAQGNFVGFQKASELLRNATKGLTNEQRAQMLQTIFGNDAMGAASALAELGADGYDAMATSLDKANGVQANAALKQQGFNTALENAKGSVEALQISLGEKLLPILTTVLTDYIAPGINALTDLAGVVFGDADAFGRLSKPLQDVITFFVPLVQWVQTAVSDFFGLDQRAQGISNALAVMGGSAGTVVQALSPFQQIIQTVGGYFQTTIMPIFQDLATALLPLLGAAIQIAAGFWSDVFLPALTTLWGILSTFVIPLLADVASWLAKNLPPAIAAASNFLTGTLFPALHDVYTFIDKNVVPVLGDIRVWLETNVPAAIQTVVGFWNNMLLPALNAGWSFLTTYIFPAFTTAYNWLATTIPAATATTAGFWNTTLLPAFQAVSNFLNTYIFPFFQALANVHLAIVDKAATATAGIWQKVLLPAFQAVWGFLNTYLSPIFKFLVENNMAAINKATNDLRWLWQNWLLPALQLVGGFISGRISQILKDFAGWLGDVSGALHSVGKAVQDVIGWLSDLASKISSISLPDWMTPGSPTPWEIGLKGVAGTIRTELNPQIKALFNTLQVAPPASAAQIMGMGAGNTTTIDSSRHINMPVTTNMTPTAIGQSLAIANAVLP